MSAVQEDPTPQPHQTEEERGAASSGTSQKVEGTGPFPIPAASSQETSQAGSGTGGKTRKRRLGRREILAIVLFGLFSGIGSGLARRAFRASEPKDDPGRFQGRWFLAVPATDRDGKPAVRAVTGVTIRISGDRLVWMVGEQEQKRYAMALRPEANPKEIDLTQLKADDTPLIQRLPPPERPVMLRGIYTIDGDRAKVVTSIGDEARPTDIDATDGVTVWLLERVE